MSSSTRDDDSITFLINSVKDDLTEIKKDIKEINDKLHNPNDGLFAKVKDVEHKSNKSIDTFSNLKQIAFIGLGAILSMVGGLLTKLF